MAVTRSTKICNPAPPPTSTGIASGTTVINPKAGAEITTNSAKPSNSAGDGAQTFALATMNAAKLFGQNSPATASRLGSSFLAGLVLGILPQGAYTGPAAVCGIGMVLVVSAWAIRHRLITSYLLRFIEYSRANHHNQIPRHPYRYNNHDDRTQAPAALENPGRITLPYGVTLTPHRSHRQDDSAENRFPPPQISDLRTSKNHRELRVPSRQLKANHAFSFRGNKQRQGLDVMVDWEGIATVTAQGSEFYLLKIRSREDSHEASKQVTLGKGLNQSYTLKAGESIDAIDVYDHFDHYFDWNGRLGLAGENARRYEPINR